MNKTPDTQQSQVEAVLKALKPFDKEAHFVKATGTRSLGAGMVEMDIIGKCSEKEKIGHYCSNNGTLAFVDENGDFWVGIPSKAAYDALHKAGYMPGYIFVPHSNDGGSWMRRNFYAPREKAAESERIRAQVEAVLKRLKPFDKEAHFVKATGTRSLGTGMVEMDIIGKCSEKEKIGHYCSNNGTLAFVDENGDFWVGRPSKAAYDALHAAGYMPGFIYVPHSNDAGSWMRRNFEKRNR